MIPAEIVQVALIVLFGALWLIQKEKNRRLRNALAAEQERARTLELENATLSGALIARPPRDSLPGPHTSRDNA